MDGRGNGGRDDTPAPGADHGTIFTDAARGALAGAAATLLMEAVDTVLHRLEPEAVRRRIREVRPEGKDPPHLFAQHISQALGRGPVAQTSPAGRAA